MSEINVTPLVDVMLVLLVIFMIAAPIMVGAVKVELPKTSSTTALQGRHFVAITIDKAGQMYMDDKRMDIGAVAQSLQRLARANPDTEVQLRADSAVSYGRVFALMGLAHQAGLSRIGFVAQTTPAAPN